MECLTFDSLKTKLYNEFTHYGLRVICCPIPDSVETTIGVQVECGTYRHELMLDKTRIPQGTAALLKEMLYYTPNGHADALFSKLGAELNSYITNSSTVFYFNTNNDYKKPLDLLLTMVTNLSFKDEDVEFEKRTLLAKQNEKSSNIDDIIQQEIVNSLYINSPMKENPYGDKEELKSIHLSTLKKFFNEKYTLKNMTLFVTGNVDPKELHNVLAARKFVKPVVESIKTPFENKEEYGEILEGNKNLQNDLQYDRVGYGIKFVPRQELFEKFGDDIFICYELLNDALSGKTNSFINQLVDEKILVDNNIKSALIQGGEDTYYYAIFNTLNTEEAIDKFEGYLENLKKHISKSEFELVKRRYMGNKVPTFSDSQAYFHNLVEIYENHFAYPAVVERVEQFTYRSFKRIIKQIPSFCHTFVVSHKKEN